MKIKLEWSEPAKPTQECRYDHCTAATPFGRFLITWKGWKEDYDVGYCLDETPWNVGEYQDWSTLDEVKAWAEQEMLKRLQACLGVALPANDPDAERYRWLRKQHWNDSGLAVVVNPKHNVKLGADCPSDERLDALIDALRKETPSERP